MNRKAKISLWLQASLMAVTLVFLATSCTEDNPNIPDNPNNPNNPNMPDTPATIEPIVNDITVTDADSNVYSVLSIGDFVWMGENLKTTKYNDGTDIANVTDSNEWKNLSSGAFCWYDNIPIHINPYGALYNWEAVKTGKLCPAGWHVATDDEWTELVKDFGGHEVAGDKLKESVFKAYPGGSRTEDGEFIFMCAYSHWWTATEVDSNRALAFGIGADYSLSLRGEADKRIGCYVRCVKD